MRAKQSEYEKERSKQADIIQKQQAKLKEYQEKLKNH